MKNLYAPLLIFATLCMTACATPSSKLAMPLVGPVPTPSSADQQIPAKGTLVVYSAIDPTTSGQYYPYDTGRYSDYELLDFSGKLVQKVHNVSEKSPGDAAEIQLPIGAYQVRAQVNGYGAMIIPVAIKQNRYTVLHLEGSYTWPEEKWADPKDAVRLPDGQIIGWKNTDE